MRKPNVIHTARRVTSGSIGLGMSRSEKLANQQPVDQPFQKSWVPGPGRKWIPEEDEQLIRDVEGGMSVYEIMAIHNRTKPAILMRVHKLNLIPSINGDAMTRFLRDDGKRQIALF